VVIGGDVRAGEVLLIGTVKEEGWIGAVAGGIGALEVCPKESFPGMWPLELPMPPNAFDPVVEVLVVVAGFVVANAEVDRGGLVNGDVKPDVGLFAAAADDPADENDSPPKAEFKSPRAFEEVTTGADADAGAGAVDCRAGEVV
jgi:hypothetical protein